MLDPSQLIDTAMSQCVVAQIGINLSNTEYFHFIAGATGSNSRRGGQHCKPRAAVGVARNLRRVNLHVS